MKTILTITFAAATCLALAQTIKPDPHTDHYVGPLTGPETFVSAGKIGGRTWDNCGNKNPITVHYSQAITLTKTLSGTKETHFTLSGGISGYFSAEFGGSASFSGSESWSSTTTFSFDGQVSAHSQLTLEIYRKTMKQKQYFKYMVWKDTKWLNLFNQERWRTWQEYYDRLRSMPCNIGSGEETPETGPETP